MMEEALDPPVWTACFGRGFGLVLKQAIKWTNEWMIIQYSSGIYGILDLKTRELIWLIGKRSPLSPTNKILIYKMVLKPIWTYGLAIWGCTAASNLAVTQRYQAKTLRPITNAPRYVPNHTLHTDLSIPPVKTVFQELTETHHTAMKSHPNRL
jgi:hypothetical protein